MRTGHVPTGDEGATSAQQLAACLCREGAQHMARGEPPPATAFFLAAFSCHAPTALRSVRAAQADARGAVLATLEAWCRGHSQIPPITWGGMAVVSLTGTLAAAFLATLCPDHPAAELHCLACLLAHGRPLEAARRCCALLATRPLHSLELQLTRALAWVLSGAADRGLADYLRAFAASAQRTVAFVHAQQQPYLPMLLNTLRGCSCRRPGTNGVDHQHEACAGLLAALDPKGTWREVLSPEALLRSGRYQDCQVACSQALQASTLPGERQAALLVIRAAAAFFLDASTPCVLGDLHEAFGQSPTEARGQLEAVLAPPDLELLRARAQQVADAGLAHFQEAVRGRRDLREDSGRELLGPVARALHVLLRLGPPGAQWALGTRLAECLLLAGDAAGAQALCERLLGTRSPGYNAGDRAHLLALHGFCALHSGNKQLALEDFQEVVACGPPQPGPCVRALCGRGLLRVLQGSAFLGALDYVTACCLRPEEALLVSKALVPWNHRGLLRTVLREEGERLLRRSSDPGPRGCGAKAAERDSLEAQEGDAQGVHQLAMLLMELDGNDEAAHLLAADALYCLGRLEDAHNALLVALTLKPQAAPVLVRLALLQLRKGFFYDANQLVKKVVQSGDTACLQPTLDIFHHKDRQLLQAHCHTRALAILHTPPAGAEDPARTREAIAYLSLAIFTAGGQAVESLLTRARCYGLLGQRKTALFDFNSVLQAEPGNVSALCGRAFLLLALDQHQEAINDIFSALKLEPQAVISEIRSLKPKARALITQGLASHCRVLLSQPQGDTEDSGATLSPEDTQGLLAVGEALVSIDSGQPIWHILLADMLTVAGSYEEAGVHLQKALHSCSATEAAQARWGLLQLKKGEVEAAARNLQGLAETDVQDLGFLLHLLDASQRQLLAQAAAQEAGILLKSGPPGPALGYCTLAVIAGGHRAEHLRLRAACLAQLRDFGRALADLDHVLQESVGDNDLPTWARDLCSQGHLLLSLGDKVGAAGAFVQALKLAPQQARSSLYEQPGRDATAHLLLDRGQRCLEEGRLDEAWEAAESGLLADPEHSGLKKLKARIQKEASSGCRLH
ncbi:tetratricopeptide repeat protein 34 isoform X2 [Erinaceus europaeus]|uniref:Tetratricopeptide repeat protein 34 isoform X2 n=1 Tax=Erinaceus europaeus TaxID=9365 RepID=A0A1S3A5E7_ERIEU|nr:tetratricopeptide repeat protein 34 isoform X2 [Erinaceus europaeus]